MLSHTRGLGQLQEYEILCRAGPVGSARGSRQAGRQISGVWDEARSQRCLVGGISARQDLPGITRVQSRTVLGISCAAQ